MIAAISATFSLNVGRKSIAKKTKPFVVKIISNVGKIISKII